MADTIMTLNFNVSDKIQDRARQNVRQGQVTIDHADKLALLRHAGLDEETNISRKAGLGLKVTVLTPKGAEIPLLMADTHAMWYSHQADENSQKLLNFLVQNGGGALDILSVEAVQLASGKRSRRKFTEEEMADCPV